MMPLWPSRQLVKNIINKTTVKPATTQQISHKAQIKDVVTKQSLLKLHVFLIYLCICKTWLWTRCCFAPWDSSWEWPGPHAEQPAGWVGCRHRWSLSTWLAEWKTRCSQRKWRRIKPVFGSYVLHCYLCERQVHHCSTVYGRGKAIMESSVLCRSHNSRGYVISRWGPLYLP